MRQFGDAGTGVGSQKREQLLIETGHFVSHDRHNDNRFTEMASSCGFTLPPTGASMGRDRGQTPRSRTMNHRLPFATLTVAGPAAVALR